MDFSPEGAQAILQLVDNCLASNEPAPGKLKKLWWSLLYIHARALAHDLRRVVGDKVVGGPFKGMQLTEDVIVSYRSPILLGCYERELHPVFEKIIARNYTRILNIGCSVGYYAVGLARSMPNTLVEAFDIDPEARAKCTALAQANGVQDRIHISGEFRGENFASYTGQNSLVLMDIEGAEADLLDPVKYPALQTMDVIVELHDAIDPTLSQTICARFAQSHKIELIQSRNYMPDTSSFLPNNQNLDYIDQFLLGWEGRSGATPWGIFWAEQ